MSTIHLETHIETYDILLRRYTTRRDCIHLWAIDLLGSSKWRLL